MYTSYFGVYLRYVISLKSQFGTEDEHWLDYANTWHSSLSGKDHRGEDPLFFCLHQDFYADLMASTPSEMSESISKRLSRAQFLKLRYLFIPIKFIPVGQSNLHSALCVYPLKPKRVITSVAMATGKYSSGVTTVEK